MSKRFTDTNIWDKEWFMDLHPAEKTAFFYIKDKCDNVGVWSPNFKSANFHIGCEIDWGKLIKHSHGNIIILENKKWFIKDFCEFQYGGIDFNSSSKPILSYIKQIEKHKLTEYFKELQYPMVTPKEKEKDKDKEKDIVEKIYLLYPGRDPIQKYSTGKCNKNKDQIKKLLKKYSCKEIEKVINMYIDDRGKSNLSLKTFSNLLDEFPNEYLGDQIEKKISSPFDGMTPDEMRAVFEKGSI